MSVVQSYRASLLWITPDGVLNAIPTFLGITLSLPANYQAPRPIGNFAVVNFVQGIRTPVLEASLVIRDTNNEILTISGDFDSPKFLDYFITRGSVSDTINLNDTPDFGTLILWDGVNETILTNVKADGFTIGTSKGDDLTFRARWVCGYSYTLYPGDTGYVDYTNVTSWDRAPLLRFQSVQVTDSLNIFDNNVWRIEIGILNNHVADYTLNGTGFPYQWRAGTPFCSAQIIVQTNDPFIDAAQFQNDPPNITMGVFGHAGQALFTINNPIDNSRDSHSIGSERVFKSHSYSCLGSTANGVYTPPLYVQSSF